VTNYFKEKFKEKKGIKYVLWVELVLAIVIGFVDFRSKILSNETQEEIKDTLNITKDLSEAILNLQGINANLSNNINDNVKQVKSIEDKSNAVINNSNNVIKDISYLNKLTNKLTGEIDSLINVNYNQNATSGTLSFSQVTPIRDRDILKIHFGDNNLNLSAVDISNGKYKEWLHLGTDLPFELKVIDGKLNFSTIVYDLNGVWITEIKNNFWRRNPCYIGKFNYDNKGFEVIDNSNYVAFAIDFVKQNEINIDGIFLEVKDHVVLIASQMGLKMVPWQPNWNIYDIEKAKSGNSIKPIFKYDNQFYLHQRSD
jgi:hypothetical protein